jgi:hypothetical protein
MHGCKTISNAVPKSLRYVLLLSGLFFLNEMVPLKAATVISPNFQVSGPDQSLAMQVARSAEELRQKISKAWLGKPLPNWPRRCPIQLRVTGGEAGGVTSFSFDRGRVTSQEMTLEGSPERILNSALPHEVTHTVFAWHFGCPMPRWADEGACMLSEDARELARQDGIINQLMERQGHMPLENLFEMEEYPKDLLGFYGQGYSVSRFLIEIGGREKFLQFVGDGAKNSWDEATRRHYQLTNTRELDRAWRSWHKVVASRRKPGHMNDKATLLTDTDVPFRATVPNGQKPLIRAQSPDPFPRR